jgi:hypothetical protein
MKNFRIGMIAGVLVVLGAILPSAAQAQIVIDMSRITCADALAMTPEQSRVFFAWISGYFNQKTGFTWIDLGAYKRNVASVKAWCATYPNEFVMTGLERATGTK